MDTMPMAIMAAPSTLAASSKMMLGDLPPNSRVTRLMVSPLAWRILLAHGAAPGEGHLVDAGMRDERLAGGVPRTGDQVEHARREARLLDERRQFQ